MQILNQAKGMNTKTFTILLFAILLINACGKDECDDSTRNLYVKKGYLPYIIPYSDTSTRLFLKNGIDTLIFKSQGLKESTNFYQESAINGLCRKYYMQKLSLTMAASDTDYFEVSLFTKYSSTLSFGKIFINNKYSSKDIFDGALVDYYPPIIKINVLNNVYDTVNVFSISPNYNIYLKPKIGIIKIETQNTKYELIK